MKTIFALIYHPNEDILLGPVLKKLADAGVNLKVLVCSCGRADYLIRNNIPHQSTIDLYGEFINIPGQKLFLNGADQHIPAHDIGRDIDKICRDNNIPSITLEHGTFFNNVVSSWGESYLFDADRMAVIGSVDYEGFRAHGVSPERLVITGFPPFDEFFEFARNSTFTQGHYIWLAGSNSDFLAEFDNLGYGCGYSRETWITVLRRIYRILLTAFPYLMILVKPHPAEPYHGTVNLYTDAIEPEFSSRIDVVSSKCPNPQGIGNSAFVVSFSPSVAFESIILKKKVINISVKEHLADSYREAEKFGVINLETSMVTIANDLYHHFEHYIQPLKDNLDPLAVPDEYLNKYLFRFDGRASERVADAVLDMMGS